MATQALFLTLSARWTRIVMRANEHISWKYRNDENEINVRMVLLWRIPLMPRVNEKVIEKNSIHPYQEPALVPLGEKPKV